ncbi:MAG TPA: molybdopterin molybdenumtransferase MoeA [Acidobacteria bacterium]|nr:molybdopterin molybdenumtransferase MoeA [Acidobacteriota bacterium]
MLHPDEAWSRIAALCVPRGEEWIARRAARGRVLARALTATVDVPAADVSAMDGYALTGPVRAGESRPVAAMIPAGAAPGYRLEPPAVVRIMTGAPVPLGADRVIPVEATDGGRETVVFHAQAGPGDHIRRRGEILAAGAPLLPAGALLTPGALSLLATHGLAELPVVRAPGVAVLTTGDEVVPPETVPAPGQLRDSHTDFLLAAGASLGLSFTSLGIAPDRVEVLREKVREGLRADVLLLCGGVSMGELDLVEGVFADLGCTIHFDAVAIQPGKPFVFATHAGGLVFGLPGNPASVMVSFQLFVRPALRRLMGFSDGWWSAALHGVLTRPVPAAGPRDRFSAAEVEARDGVLHVTPYPPKGSHDLAAYAHGTGLVRRRAGTPPGEVGGPCEVLVL